MPDLQTPPTGDPMVTQANYVEFRWLEWLQRLIDGLNKSTKRLFNSVTLTEQSASIAATDMTDGTIQAGLYRVTYYARITTVDTVSSSLTVTIDWTDGGVNPSYSGAAMTGNLTTTTQSGTIMFRADEASAINYSTTLVLGNNDGEYRLDVYLEEVPE